MKKKKDDSEDSGAKAEKAPAEGSQVEVKEAAPAAPDGRQQRRKALEQAVNEAELATQQVLGEVEEAAAEATSRKEESDKAEKISSAKSQEAKELEEKAQAKEEESKRLAKEAAKAKTKASKASEEALKARDDAEVKDSEYQEAASAHRMKLRDAEKAKKNLEAARQALSSFDQGKSGRAKGEAKGDDGGEGQ